MCLFLVLIDFNNLVLCQYAFIIAIVSVIESCAIWSPGKRMLTTALGSVDVVRSSSWEARAWHVPLVARSVLLSRCHLSQKA